MTTVPVPAAADLEKLVTPFRTLVSFVLGGFVIQVVTAWYRRRVNAAAFYSSMRTAIVVIASLVQPAPEADPQQNRRLEVAPALCEGSASIAPLASPTAQRRAQQPQAAPSQPARKLRKPQ